MKDRPDPARLPLSTLDELFEMLGDSNAIGLATIDVHGTLIRSNRGFRRAAGLALEACGGGAVGARFVAPSWQEIVASHGPVAYRGVLNLGDENAATSLRGSVLARGAVFVVVAEHPIDDLQGLSDRVIELNQDLGRMQRELVRANRALARTQLELERSMLTDPLTGLANRRHLDRRLREEFARAARHDTPLGIAMADIDHFKRINDEHGHIVGDRVLEGFARMLETHLRVDDFAARYGGEEFVLLLANTTIDEAYVLLERLRAQLARTTLGTLDAPITASFGVAQVDPTLAAEAALAAADGALYAAKRAGRNRVMRASIQDAA